MLHITLHLVVNNFVSYFVSESENGKGAS